MRWHVRTLHFRTVRRDAVAHMPAHHFSRDDPTTPIRRCEVEVIRRGTRRSVSACTPSTLLDTAPISKLARIPRRHGWTDGQQTVVPLRGALRNAWGLAVSAATPAGTDGVRAAMRR